LRLLADQAFSRAAGAPLVGGNAVRLLKDAAENFPAWLEAIRSAERSIFFESYIFGDDATGREFRDALAVKARAGVRVRVLHDWLGSPGKIASRFWRSLGAAGAAVRTFNRPRFDSPLGWLSRDHRKSICIDGRIAYVSGLCVADDWLGEPATGREAWRDTGIEIRGPAVADVERAFAQVWAATGTQLGNDELTDPARIASAGDVNLRVVASAPATAGLMRLDQLIASIARLRLWLTDAYFVPVSAYVQALCAASRDGVDVRLLVPGASDIPVVSPLSRSAYRPLLESGVRVFEWNGTMLHAKTAVADGRWARVGSTNLNLASFIGNYELDVAVEDGGFAAVMERQYRDDLTRATEIVLQRRRRTLRPVPAQVEKGRARRAPSGSAGRAAAGAVRLGSAVGAAITRPRELVPQDGRIMGGAAAALVVLAAVGILWPQAIAWPLAAIFLWLGIAFLIRAWRGRREKPQAAPRLDQK
jgi:cardiolipin synthase